MRKNPTPFGQRNSDERESSSDELRSIENVIETDELIEAHLAELESLLERRGDATLELAQLRQLRQSCKRVKALIGKYENAPVVGASDSR